LEQLLDQARTGNVPAQLLKLEDEANARRLAQWRQEHGLPEPPQPQQQQQQADAAPAGGSDGSTSAAAGGADLVELELEGVLSLLKGWLPAAVPREGQAFLSLGGIACSVVAALRDAYDSDGAADWTGLVGGFAAGLALGYAVCPVYEMTFAEVDTSSSDGGGSSSSSGSSGTGSGSSCSSRRPRPGSSSVVLLPVLRDTRLPAARANAVVGYAAALFAALAAWLVTNGAFLEGFEG
jgi:hypothetical protein